MHTALLSRIPTSLFVALFLILGISWQAFNNPIVPALLIIITTLIALWEKQNLQVTIQRLLLAFIAFCCGGLRYGTQEYYYAQAAQQLCNKKISIRGEVLQINSSKSAKATMIVAIDSVNAKKQPVLHVQLMGSGDITCEIGDTIAIDDLFFTPPSTESYAQYLKKEGIVATARVYEQQKFTVIARPATLCTWIEQRRAKLIERLAIILSPQTLSLVNPIFFGYKAEKTAHTDLLREQFQWWGISHYLARSGLHLVMFIFIIQFFCAYIPISINTKRFIVACCIGFYSIFSFMNISFARSLLMILLYFCCSWSRIPQHALHTIATVCILILLHNPQQLFALDFQLSFILTLALILLKP
jgi:hypothetical protein